MIAFVALASGLVAAGGAGRAEGGAARTHRSAQADGADRTSTWEDLEVGGLEWNPEIHLWGRTRSKDGSDESTGDRVHRARFASGQLLLAGRLGLIDDPRVAEALASLERMQMPSTGAIRQRYEDEGVTDSNEAFFVARNLLLLKVVHGGAMRDEARRRLDALLTAFYDWFYHQAMGDHAHYPNKYLGDLVCARLIQQQYGAPKSEREAVKRRTLRAVRYWCEHEWGWGEHMSDIYGGTCMDLISLYLLLTNRTEGEVHAAYEGLLDELSRIDARYAGGPRVPVIRSYAFRGRGGVERYASKIRPWNPEMAAIRNPFWRENALIKAAYHEMGWSRRFGLGSDVADNVPRGASIACFGGATAESYIAEDMRIGAMSRFPIMPEAEHVSWGLAWQSFPVALWKPEGDWGFLQWEVENGDGEVKAHPANRRGGARALTERVNPPITGRTYSLRREGNILVLRVMPAVARSWTRITDRFKILDATAEFQTQADDARWGQLLLEYPERTVGVAAFSLAEGVAPAFERAPNGAYWGFDFPERAFSGDQTQHWIVNVWGFSLDGEIQEAPAVEMLDDYGKVPRSDPEKARRVTWRWPGVTWDVVIDPRAEKPLRAQAK